MMQNRLKILWITNIPSPYRIDFFNELGKLCFLTVLFEKGNSTERDENWHSLNFLNFKGLVLKGKSTDVDKAFSFSVLKYLNKKEYDYTFITSIATPTGIIATEFMKLFKMQYIIEGDGGFAKSGKGIKEFIKKHLIKGALGYFSTAKSHDDYYLKYGARKEYIYRYPFTSIMANDLLINVIDNKEKQFIKNKLGISEKKVVLSVGQYIYRKGYDVLLNSCKEISKEFGIYIIGGQPTTDYINIKDELQLENVHFVEFISKDKLKEYYMMADVFVLPTREDIWGLVINEAMSYGLPIITTNKCVAGLELVGDNGYIIPVDDQNMLAEKINFILNNDKAREIMANSSLKKIREYTIENMAQRHIEILNTLK